MRMVDMSNERFEDLRDEKDLKKRDVAKVIGVVESVYSEWENGKLSIPTKRLVRYSTLPKPNG